MQTRTVNKYRQLIGSELKKARTTAGVNKHQLMRLVGYFERSVFYRWEKGAFLPSLGNLIRLCIIYDCSLQELCPSIWKIVQVELENRKKALRKRKEFAGIYFE